MPRQVGRRGPCTEGVVVPGASLEPQLAPANSAHCGRLRGSTRQPAGEAVASEGPARAQGACLASAPCTRVAECGPLRLSRQHFTRRAFLYCKQRGACCAADECAHGAKSLIRAPSFPSRQSEWAPCPLGRSPRPSSCLALWGQCRRLRAQAQSQSGQRR